MNKKELRKIKNDEPLPVHVKDTDGNELDYDEIRVRFICEQIFQTKILNSDRPDLYAENQHFGIEVTSASDIPCIIYRDMGDGKLKPKQINYNLKFDFLTMRSYFMPDIFKLISGENLRARKYIIAQHNGEEAPDSPAEAMEKYIML